MSHLDPIAYTYDADYHCVDCAIKAFGKEPDENWVREDAVDSEGNPVGSVAPWDEWQHFDGGNETLVCGTCGIVIDEYEGIMEDE